MTLIYRNILKYVCRCRSGNGKYPMGTVHMPSSHIYIRSLYPVRLEHIYKKAYRRYVRYRIRCSNLMEMYFRYRPSVGMALSLRNKSIYINRMLLYLIRQLKPCNDVLNVMKTAVNVGVRFMMIMAVLMLMISMVMMSMTVIFVMVVMPVVVIVLTEAVCLFTALARQSMGARRL